MNEYNVFTFFHHLFFVLVVLLSRAEPDVVAASFSSKQLLDFSSAV